MAAMAPDGNSSKKSDGAIRERAATPVVTALLLGKSAKEVAIGIRGALKP